MEEEGGRGKSGIRYIQGGPEIQEPLTSSSHMCPLRNATHKLKAYGTVLPTKHLSPKPRDMEPKQPRSPVNHPRTSFLRGSANGCSSESTFPCGVRTGCVGARTRKKGA